MERISWHDSYSKNLTVFQLVVENGMSLTVHEIVEELIQEIVSNETEHAQLFESVLRALAVHDYDGDKADLSPLIAWPEGWNYVNRWQIIVRLGSTLQYRFEWVRNVEFDTGEDRGD